MKKLIYHLVLLLIIILCFNSLIFAEGEPLINPLNNMEAYKELKYSTSDIIDISYEDEEGNSINKTIRGEYWYYKIPGIKDADTGREDFADYINDLSGNILFRLTKKCILKQLKVQILSGGERPGFIKMNTRSM